MKPFRLAGLVRLREVQEQQAGAELALRRTEREQVTERRNRAESDLDDAVLPQQGDAGTWQAAVAARVAATSAAQDAKVADHLARDQEDLAQQEWNQARSRSIVLDKLAQRHHDSEYHELLRTEQLRLDEIAARQSAWDEREQA